MHYIQIPILRYMQITEGINLKHKDKIYLNVKVQPCSRKREIDKKGPTEYRIRVLSPPSKGKANKEVIEIIASHFDVPVSCVRIIKGHKSRNKIIELESGK